MSLLTLFKNLVFSVSAGFVKYFMKSELGGAEIVFFLLISLSLSSYYEKAAEGLCVGRIQTRLGVA